MTRTGRNGARSQGGLSSFAATGLMALVVAAAFGSYASLAPSQGSPLFAFRLLGLLLLLPALGAFRGARPWSAAPTRWFLVLILAWCVWSLASLLWAPDFDRGFAKVVAVSFAMLGALDVVGLARGSAAGVEKLRRGFVAAFVLTGLVGFWEIGTGEHLPGATRGDEFEYVCSTFSNPNNYAAFLLVCLPVLAVGLFGSRSRLGRSTYCLLILSAVFLLVHTHSRTGTLGIAAMIVAIVLMLPRSRSAMVAAVALAFCALATLLTLGLESPFATTRGDYARGSLFSLGWQTFIDSSFFGAGPASFERMVGLSGGGTDVGSAVDAHNTFLEVAAEFGVVVLVPLLVMLAVLFRIGFLARVRAGRDRQVRLSSMLLVTELLALVAAATVASSTLTSSWWWVVVGYVVSLGWMLQSPAPVDSDSSLFGADPTASRTLAEP